MKRVLVAEKQPQAVVITAQEPSTTAREAAEELITYVKQATGAELPLLAETEPIPDNQTRIIVGNTALAAEQGIVHTDLEPDAFILRTTGSDIFVLGREQEISLKRDRRSGRECAGTLYGVYELLERYLGVLWLWPGELGTYVPKRDTLAIADELDEVIKPAFRFRRFRAGHLHQQAKSSQLSFSDPGLAAYDRDLSAYLQHHRAGDTEPKPPVGHYFQGWWERYGEEHPDWFMMQPDGQRGPKPDESTYHVAMCVSNPDLHRFIVDEVWDGGDRLSLGEVDRRVFCQCENCLAWDGPQPDDPPEFAVNLFQPQVVSDRYARFWLTIQEMASKRNPDVLVSTFLYWNYMPAPLSDLTLNEHIYGEFVPWGQPSVTFYPMSAEADAWNRDQWLGWKRAGVTMAYRPNYFHGGYVMPHLSTWQIGEFFQFGWENGMIGFDQDALYGHWATKGPMFYIHMRLTSKPDMAIADIRREYFSSFGPAAALVEAYFDYWEDYAAGRPGSPLTNPVDAHIAYPPDVFPPAESMLEQALTEAKSDPLPEYAERVRFLQAGLEHARLAAAFMATLDMGHLPTDDSGRMEKARQALEELIAFRRAHEHLYIADFCNAAYREERFIDIAGLMD